MQCARDMRSTATIIAIAYLALHGHDVEVASRATALRLHHLSDSSCWRSRHLSSTRCTGTGQKRSMVDLERHLSAQLRVHGGINDGSPSTCGTALAC